MENDKPILFVNLSNLRNYIKLAERTNDTIFLVANRDSAWMTPEFRRFMNHNCKYDAPLIEIPPRAQIRLRQDNVATVHIESFGDVDLRCIRGIFFKNAGLTFVFQKETENEPQPPKTNGLRIVKNGPN